MGYCVFCVFVCDDDVEVLFGFCEMDDGVVDGGSDLVYVVLKVMVVIFEGWWVFGVVMEVLLCVCGVYVVVVYDLDLFDG